MTTSNTWLAQVSAVTSFVDAALANLNNSDRLHIEQLSGQCSDLTNMPPNTLKLMVSSYVESLEGFKVVRGKYGGAMRDVPENRPKAQQNAEAVAARKAERAEKKALNEAAAEARRQERAAKATSRAEAARLKAEKAAAAAAAAAVSSTTEVTTVANDQGQAEASAAEAV